MTANLIQRLIEAGTPAALVAEVAMELAKAQAERDILESRRKNERDRKAKSRDVTGQHGTSQDIRDNPPSPLSLSPTPPNPNPPITPRSETNVSGADAPNIVAFDPRADLFGRGVQAVIEMTGKASPQAKTMIGHWLKLVSDEALVVLRAIDEAVDHRPANPTAWIEGRLRKAGRGPPHGGRPRAAEGFL